MAGLEDYPEVPEDQRRRQSWFNWDHLRLKVVIDQFVEEAEVRQKRPNTSRLLERVGEALFAVLDEIDSVLSGNQECALDNVLTGEIELAVIESANERRQESDTELN